MPSLGGPPRRLTFLGAEALYVCGWSPDGAEVFFTSDSGSPFIRETTAFAVPAAGGPVRALNLGHALSFAIAAGGATVIGRNATDPARWKRYRGGTAGQLWVDAAGSVGEFAGRFEQGAMRFTGETHTREGRRVLRRLTLAPDAFDRVRQTSEASTNDGRNWRPHYDFTYIRHDASRSQP